MKCADGNVLRVTNIKSRKVTLLRDGNKIEGNGLCARMESPYILESSRKLNFLFEISGICSG